MAFTKIAYEPHPCSVDRKRELNAQGFQVLDARFKPAGAVDAADSDGDGETSKDELIAVLEERGIEFDKRWGVTKLRDALEAADSDG